MNTTDDEDPAGPEIGMAFVLVAVLSAPLWLSLCALLAEVLK